MQPYIDYRSLDIRVADAMVMPSLVWADTNPSTIRPASGWPVE